MHSRSTQILALLQLNPELTNKKSGIGLAPRDLVQGCQKIENIMVDFEAKHTLHGVARTGNISLAEKIIAENPNSVLLANAFGETPLHVAAIFCRTKMIQVYTSVCFLFLANFYF